jgi:hypothetical protein
MFPESFAERWINELTRKNDTILDPFSGRGTTAFCAASMGRPAIASDVNHVAYCLTYAKTNAPSLRSLKVRLEALSDEFKEEGWIIRARAQGEFFQWAFHERTLAQILFLRQHLRWRNNRTDAMIAALALGSLHGEVSDAKSYFSNQMPRTISTKPRYSVRFWKERGLRPPERDVFEIILRKALFRYASPLPLSAVQVLNSDVRSLPSLLARRSAPIKAVITSPPYFDTTNFEEDQWLRLWFLGGFDSPRIGYRSTDDRHGDENKYWRFISDMWRVLGAVVSRNGAVVIRIGSPRSSPDQLASKLLSTSVFTNRRVTLSQIEVSEIRRRQTDNFHPGTRGCLVEVDCHFRLGGKA